MVKKLIFITIVFLSITLYSKKSTTNNGGGITTPPVTNPPITNNDIAKGADISWLTEMEASGRKFYNNTGTEKECLQLMKDLGMNALRMRVWVNPANGWNNTSDVLVKTQLL